MSRRKPTVRSRTIAAPSPRSFPKSTNDLAGLPRRVKERDLDALQRIRESLGDLGVLYLVIGGFEWREQGEDSATRRTLARGLAARVRHALRDYSAAASRIETTSGKAAA